MVTGQTALGTPPGICKYRLPLGWVVPLPLLETVAPPVQSGGDVSGMGGGAASDAAPKSMDERVAELTIKQEIDTAV